MNRQLVTFGFLLAAAAAYAVGITLVALAFVVLGVLLEGVFWYRYFVGRKRSRDAE